jgi:beta-glucosidase
MTYQYYRGKPLYPFGYGLSYTSFRYGAVHASRVCGSVQVSVDVANTGARSGTEVVQLYSKESGVQRFAGLLPGDARTATKRAWCGSPCRWRTWRPGTPRWDGPSWLPGSTTSRWAATLPTSPRRSRSSCRGSGSRRATCAGPHRRRTSTILGTASVSSTGDRYAYTTVTAALAKATGRHDVYLTFDGPVNLATFSLR